MLSKEAVEKIRKGRNPQDIRGYDNNNPQDRLLYLAWFVAYSKLSVSWKTRLGKKCHWALWGDHYLIVDESKLVKMTFDEALEYFETEYAIQKITA